MATKARRVELDDILREELGQFGRFQLRTLLLALVIVVFMSWGANEYVFTTARINTRCLVPECDGPEPEFAPPWILNAAPAATGCARYAPAANTSAADTCPSHLFDTSTLLDCKQRLYENTLSVVYDFDLGCAEWLRSLIGTLRTLGVMTALPLTGYVSDGWGRRAALVASALNTAWLGAVRYFANTYAGFVISEFAESTFGSGGFSCAYIIVTEVVGPRYRVAAGATMNTFFSVGQITLGLIAWAVPAWRNLTLALYLPQLVSIAYLWIISESVRWYWSKDRYDEAEKVLKKIAKVNNRQLSAKSLAAVRATAEEEKRNASERRANKEREPWLVMQVFRNKTMLLRCCVSPVWWVSNLFTYYGMSVNAVNMSGDRYLNYMAVSAAQIPGYWAAVLLLERLGRRPVLVMAFWLGAACQTAYIFMPADMAGAALAVYLVGTFTSAVTMTAVYVYTLELYPTRYRHSLFAFSSMMGRVGSMLAPLTPALSALVWDKLPFALFGGLALLSGALIFLTPETRGAALPDTFQQAADLVTEVVGPRYRVAAGATMNTFFSVGQITLGLIAWAVPAWRNLTLALYLPQLVSIAYLWIISESVRWYWSKDRYDEAEKVLKKIAKVNNRQLSAKSLAAVRATAEEEKRNASERRANKEREPWLVMQVFRNKTMLLRCCVSPVWWVSNLFTYYGMSVNAVNMSGDRYLNYMAVSAAQIPGYWAAVLLLERLGRRPVLVMAFWLGAACQTAYIFMPADMAGAALAVYLVGTFTSAVTMTAVYVYTLELYPTRYRHSLFAFSSMMGRVGSMLAPLTPALSALVWDKLPFALFGGLALLSGALIFLTPETRGAALPDTFQQAADLGNPKKKPQQI